MNTKLKSFLIIAVPAIIAFILGPVLWKSAPGPAPEGIQVFLFILISALEALTFGFGVWFLMNGYKKLKSVGGGSISKGLVTAAYIATAWSLLSWWPHDNLHRANGESINGLLGIEYGFHVTLYIAAIIIAIFFLKALSQERN